MKLLTKEIARTLPPLYAQEKEGIEAIVHVKYFTPDAQWTWFITEGSPVEDGHGNIVDYRFFGLVHGMEKEYGYTLLSQLAKLRGPLGLPVERDLHWKPTKLADIN